MDRKKRHKILLSTILAGEELPTVNFDLNKITFTAAMAKRLGAVFAAAPIIQGKADGTGTTDILSISNGSKLGNLFYTNLDLNQGTISFWITPEWNGNDGISHYIFLEGNGALAIYKNASNNLLLTVNDMTVSTSAAALVAGTIYHIAVRWDLKNKLDGTNYGCISINDTHTFGGSLPTTPSMAASSYIGSYAGVSGGANAIIEGFTVYRRPLFDGTYGKDVGNGDEINLISAGRDPTSVTGSWDVVFCLPTNQALGALASGSDDAWTHPHSSNILTDWLFGNNFYNHAWSLGFNGSTSKVDCSSDAGLDNLQDAEFTAEAWIRINNAASGTRSIMGKGGYYTEGWSVYWSGVTNQIVVYIPCATTVAVGLTAAGSITNDNKWHHLAVYFNDTGDRKIYIAIDGVWQTLATQTAGVGAVVSDASYNLLIGDLEGLTGDNFLGNMGWCRVSNNDRYSHSTNFTPALASPASDANTIAQWNMAEGTGTTLDNIEGTAGRDGTITAGTWTPEWITAGTPTTPAADLATAEKIYNWGWKFTAAADGDGIKQTFTGVTAGSDRVIRLVAHSSSVNPINLQIYDETNSAVIKDYDFGSLDKILNGDFASDSIWSKGTGWTISGGKANSASTGYLSQSTNLEVGKRYQVIYTVSGYTSGAVRIFLGDGGGTPATADGTYTETITCVSNGTIYIGGTFTGSIDNISCIPITDSAAPGIALLSFELPTAARGASSDCTSYSVIITGTAAAQVVYIHQCELLPNLLDNPSLDTGAAADPWVPDGWTNTTTFGGLAAGDSTKETTVIHSTGASIKVVNPDVALGGISYRVLSGTYLSIGAWLYGYCHFNGLNNTTYINNHNSLAARYSSTHSDIASWGLCMGIGRRVNGNIAIEFRESKTAYADDLYVFALTSVAITVTPASQANSLESGGIRVDGRDICRQDSIRFSPTGGKIRWKIIPRHSSADVYKYRESGVFILLFIGTGSNMSLEFTAANTLRFILTINSTTVFTDFSVAGKFVPGVANTLEISVENGIGKFKLDGTVLATLTNTQKVFSNTLFDAYFGNYISPTHGQMDAVFLTP